ncbi:MAG TPA: endolytic transglycosylase MltG [Thermomonospora sp.]|nr:endolytic transglycosylase MltG [Thermomonospora sp.]
MNDLDLFEEPGRGDHPGEARYARRTPVTARKRQRRRKMNGRAAVMFSLAFLVAVFGGGGLLGLVALEKRLSTPDYSGQGSGRVTVQVKEGDSGQDIGRRLAAADVVKSSKAYVRAANKDPRSASIQPGFYAMRKKMSGAAALALLLDPSSRAGNQLTIPEGLRVSQVIELLAKKTGIPREDFKAVQENPSALDLPSYADGKLEGFLWPGRYDLDPEGTAESILKTMVDRFKTVTEDMELEDKARQAGTTPEKVLTMASIIQAESGKPSDMPKISRVIYNRLKKRMQLQMDSTVMYALNKFGIAATHDELNTSSPYNTYRNHGLPPGPISNPGAKAIEAVFKPKSGDWLYFVTTNPDKGITEFAETQEQHDRLVQKFNDYMRRRNGGN